jgi:phosphoadenosine phosphosulfate reductase
MVSIDNLRHDCIGYQSDKRELIKYDVLKYLETPTLDKIAEKSLCFTQCISTSTYTTASHASIFTGLYPPRHGVRAFFDTRLSSDVVTIAETFKRNGYKTILHSDSLELFVPLGLNRGFEFELTRTDDRLFYLLRSFRDENVFLFCHFMDVHEPFLHNTNSFLPKINDDYLDELFELYKKYNLLDSYERDDSNIELWNRLMRGVLSEKPIDILFPLYVKGITKFDKGRFDYFIDTLKKIGFLDNALLAIFSDHGEGRCYHDNKKYFAHGCDLYDNVIKVPLIINHGDITPGIAEKIVSLTDLFPTISSILRMEVPKNLDGLNILSENRSHCYSEVWHTYGELQPTDDGLVKAVNNEVPESILNQMGIRTSKQKFILRNKGKIENFKSNELSELSNIEYVKKLFRDILGKIAQPEGLKHYIDILNNSIMTKEELLNEFLNLDEYKVTPRFSFYELQKDLYEDYPIDASSNEEAKIYFEFITRLNDGAIITEKIFEEKVHTHSPKTEIISSASLEEKSLMFKSLNEKEQKSIVIIKRAVELYGAENIGVAWTGGKDSTTVLHIIKQAFGNIPFKAINIDTTVDFPEIYEIIDYLKKQWNINLHIFKNEKASQLINISKDHAECCYQLKTLPLNEAITSLKIKALITALRWDEQEARVEEVYFSERERPVHVRVQPILHFREVDIWQYIKKYGIPYCELYNKGYRSLGCVPCTTISMGRHERSGRSQNKEQIMSKLRELGYF